MPPGMLPLAAACKENKGNRIFSANPWASFHPLTPHTHHTTSTSFPSSSNFAFPAVSHQLKKQEHRTCISISHNNTNWARIMIAEMQHYSPSIGGGYKGPHEGYLSMGSRKQMGTLNNIRDPSHWTCIVGLTKPMSKNTHTHAQSTIWTQWRGRWIN